MVAGVEPAGLNAKVGADPEDAAAEEEAPKRVEAPLAAGAPPKEMPPADAALLPLAKENMGFEAGAAAVAAPKDGVDAAVAAPKDGVDAAGAPPKDGVEAAAPNDGVEAAAPKEGEAAAPPKDGVEAAAPKAGWLAGGTPKLGAEAAEAPNPVATAGAPPAPDDIKEKPGALAALAPPSLKPPAAAPKVDAAEEDAPKPPKPPADPNAPLPELAPAPKDGADPAAISRSTQSCFCCCFVNGGGGGVVQEREREREKGRATGFTGLGQRKLAGRGRSRTTRQEPGLGPSMGRGRGVPREAGLGLGTYLRKMALRIHRLLRKPSSSCGSRYSVLVSLTLSLLQRAHRTPSRCRFWFGQTLLSSGGGRPPLRVFLMENLGLGGIQPLNFEIRSAAGKGACVGTSARGRQSKARVAERLGTMGGATRRSNAYSKIDTETNDGEEALKDAFAHFPPLKVSLPRFATALVLERP